jgi:hypothetical protein
VEETSSAASSMNAKAFVQNDLTTTCFTAKYTESTIQSNLLLMSEGTLSFRKSTTGNCWEFFGLGQDIDGSFTIQDGMLSRCGKCC